MAPRDPDLHNAISLKPSPFHPHPERPSRHQSPEPSHARPQQQQQPGASSAVEPVSSQSKEAQAHTRGVYHRSSSESDRDDVERQNSNSGVEDPFKLRESIKNIADEKQARANTKVKRTCQPINAGKDKSKSHKIIAFYENQNDNIERLLKPVDDHVREAKEEQGADALQYKIAVNGSFAANIILAILQIYGATSSGSLSLFTTMADSIFDPLSNITLILCHRAVNKVDARRFPSGKARLENAGNIAFCFLMTAVSLVLIVLSIMELADGKKDVKFHYPSVIAVGVAFVTKLALFAYCWSLRNKYSQVRILWEDHRNDLFINGFGLMTSVLGSRVAWWIDPAGAVVLSLLISVLWLSTAKSEFLLLIGVTADTAFLQHVTYISMTHDPRVTSLDTVRAWHSGPRIIIEVDIVMDQELSLRETHDVAEDLQMKLESLPDVERAYVHVDYETTHSPEHFLKKEL